MDRRFLIGNFLPAYGTSFGRLKTRQTTVHGLGAEKLEARFAERARLRAQRRRRYTMLLEVTTALSLVIVTLLFQFDFNPKADRAFELAAQEIVQMEEIVQTRQIERPPPPPRPPVPVVVPDDVALEDDALDFDAVLDFDVALAEPPPPAPARSEASSDAEPEIFVAVEQMPEMVGGMQALFAELEYPEIARRSELEGTVVVQITINEDGRPSDPVVLKSVHEVLDREAIRAILLQKYVPGKQRDRPVKVYMNIPVIFRLN